MTLLTTRKFNEAPVLWPNLLSDFFMDGKQEVNSFVPSINISESTEKFTVLAECPGVREEDLSIEVTKDSLVISGEKKVTTEQEDAKPHRREIFQGKFTRTFNLNVPVNTEKVTASMANGILKIELPKTEEEKVRKIQINS